MRLHRVVGSTCSKVTSGMDLFTLITLVLPSLSSKPGPFPDRVPCFGIIMIHRGLKILDTHVFSPLRCSEAAAFPAISPGPKRGPSLIVQ